MRSPLQADRVPLPDFVSVLLRQKGLGLALDKPIVHVPTVDGLAYNLWGHKDFVCPLMDARRNQTYTGLYEFTADGMNILVESCAVGIEEILEKNK